MSKLPDLFAPLLPTCAKVVEGPIVNLEHLLTPQESACVSQAVPKRRMDFAWGGTSARRAVKSFHSGDCSLLMDSDRVPIWPAGLIGSITHSNHYCAVAVARKTQVSAIGIDVEELKHVTLDLTEYI